MRKQLWPWCLVPFLGPLPLSAQSPVPPSHFTIKNILVNGNGCRKETFTINLAEDRRSFNLQFWKFLAEYEPSDPSFSRQRQSCQITLDLEAPLGWQFALASFQEQAFLKIEEGIKAEMHSSYYFQGEEAQAEQREIFLGPREETLIRRTDIPLENRPWSFCDRKRALNIKASLRVYPDTKRDARGLLSFDSLDGSLPSLTWALDWKPCP